MLSEPSRTPYDLQFQVAGFPVRVHPLFWLAAIVLGANGMGAAKNPGLLIVTWVAVMFASIMVHELGHAFVMRYYGQSARICLYMLGGLAIPDSSPYAYHYGSSRTPQQQIVISAAGPCAGFLTALLIVAGVFAAGGNVSLNWSTFPWFWRVDLGQRDASPLAFLVDCALQINILWGLLNLLPIYPLDGGQIARELLVLRQPGIGMIQSLWLSVFTAGAMAVWSLVGREDGGFFMALLFGSLAFNSYMILKQFGGGGFGGGRWGGGGGRPW